MSSSDLALSVRGLSKSYTIKHNVPKHEMVTSALAHRLLHPFQRLETETFWALKDVCFDVKQGEVMGIIGRNGAGKSTLLKILSRITEPTTGEINLYGRVGSLLEVGTGFHPELTGRENVYLNGAILGMTSSEIARHFDEIVDFAGVEQFLDTPVKRYSSGMYVRLAFAVAAHLNPEILIVDEVLAVGDAAFQKKCLGKLGDVARDEGRTVLFVSHNMGAVRSLCSKALWIDAGSVKQEGRPDSLIDAYLKSLNETSRTASAEFAEDQSKDFQLLSACLKTVAGDVTQAFDCDQAFILELVCRAYTTLPGLYGYMSINRADGTVVMVSDSFDTEPNPLDGVAIGKHVLKVTIPQRTLAPGDYSVYVSFACPSSIQGFNVDVPGTIMAFRVDDYMSQRGNDRQGFFSTMLRWEVTIGAGQTHGARPASADTVFETAAGRSH